MEVLNHSLWLMLGYQSFGVSLYLLYENLKEKSKTRILFAAFMLVFSITSFLMHIRLFSHAASLYVLFPLIFSVGLLLTPIFYFHLKSLLVEKFVIRKKDALHALPAILVLMLMLPFWVLISSDNSEYLDSFYGALLIKSWPGNQTWLIKFMINLLIVAQMVIYLYYALNLYRSFQEKMKMKNCPDLAFYLTGTKFFGVSYLLMMALLISHEYFHGDADSIVSTLFIAAVLILNIGLGYFGIRFNDDYFFQCSEFLSSNIQAGIYLSERENAENLDEEKYKTSCLCDELKEVLVGELENLMNTEEPYLNSKIKLEDVAIRLHTNSKYLSQTINEKFSKNFQHYLNDYRCAKVIKLFHDEAYDDYSIEGIAATCGFHSRSSFVASFKKYTGKLPSEYRKEVHQELEKKNDPS